MQTNWTLYFSVVYVIMFWKNKNELGKAMQNIDTASLYIDIPRMEVDEWYDQV